jgi:hypothetical protein
MKNRLNAVVKNTAHYSVKRLLARSNLRKNKFYILGDINRRTGYDAALMKGKIEHGKTYVAGHGHRFRPAYQTTLPDRRRLDIGHMHN